MSQELQLNAGTLSSTCWPASPQAFANDLMAVSYALMGDITGILIQDTAPDPEDRDKAWIPTTAAGGPPSYAAGPFIWSNGAWIARHPVAPAGSERRLWVGLEADLTTYDGGDSGALGDTSGPMWQVDHEFDGRVPMGPGTIPGTALSATVATNTDSGGGSGAYTRTLARANLPNERLHLFSNNVLGEPLTDIDSTGVAGRYADVSSEKQSYRISKDASVSNPTVGVTEALGDGTSFVQAPPFRGVFFIKRTTRIYYRAS